MLRSALIRLGAGLGTGCALAFGLYLALGPSPTRPSIERSIGSATADGSYASSNDARVLFGLGTDRGEQQVRVVWPDGSPETWARLETGKYHDLHRGSGSPGGQ